MGTLLVVVLVAVAAWVVWKLWKKPDLNNDGAFDAKDVVAAVKEVAVEAKAEVVNVLDTNKDGKVDVADAKVAAEVVTEKVKKARKPRAPKKKAE